MVVNVWKPTFPIQLGLVVASSLISQLVPYVSHIPTYQSITQSIQAQFNVIQPS